MNKTKMICRSAVLIATTALLAGCAATTHVKADGTTDKPVWPQWDKATFNKNRGTFPNVASLGEVKAGMTKDQLYALIGRPHYGEAWRPVEWNYLFHFHTPGQGTDGVTTCQFKALFDQERLTRRFYWNPVDPANGTCPPGAPVASASQNYTLPADALFPFGRSELSAAGKQELAQLAGRLKTFEHLNAVHVAGHTDYLGSSAYNQKLSQQRADTVRHYLINQGLDADIVHAQGMGEGQPLMQCSNTGKRAELIACLQPNRRVDIRVDGTGTVR